MHFANTALREAYQKSDVAIRRWGAERGRRYIQRVEALYAATTFEDIRAVRAFRVHELKGGKKGEWAIRLGRRLRLMVILSDDEREVTIEEVSQHYGD